MQKIINDITNPSRYVFPLCPLDFIHLKTNSIYLEVDLGLIIDLINYGQI